jgi:excisionase family DNA binding protein
VSDTLTRKLHSETAIAALKAELFSRQLDNGGIKAVLGISDPTLERYIGNGLPNYKVGRRRLFDIDAVRSWMLSHQQNAPARRPGRPRKVVAS